MRGELIVLRLIHVLCGTFWVGSGLFTTFFLMPALANAGAGAGQIMGEFQRRRLFVVLPISALLTIASGVRLMAITSGGFAPGYFRSPSGMAYAISGLASVVAFVLSLVVARPAGRRLGQLGSELASLVEESQRAAILERMARVRRTSTIASVMAVGLLTLGAAGMGVARYLAG